MNFADLGLSEAVLRAIAEAGYTQPTPIQEQAIPYVLMARDIVGCAQTGTGKTASFTLPMIDVLASGRARARMPRSLILEPTRELAAQVAENFDVYGKYNRLSMALLIGGVSFDEQIRLLDRGVDVLIATPGRLLDHISRGRILLSDIKILVIDEADRMLDMGFIPDIEQIVKLLPPMRQTLMFSATMPPEIRRLAAKFLSNPKEVSVAPPASPAETVTQALLVVDEMDKRETLRRLIRSEDVQNALIFCNRKKDVDTLFRSLKKHGFNVGALHGDMDQGTRTETLERFRDGTISLLVASDVAARGLDIARVSHVFNFDVPQTPDDYIHRIGRTGRAGRSGKAFMLATPDEAYYLDSIEKLIGRDVPRTEIEGIETATLGPADKRRRGRGTKAKPHAESTGRSRRETPKSKPRAEAKLAEAKPQAEAEITEEPEAAPAAAPVSAAPPDSTPVEKEPKPQRARAPRPKREERKGGGRREEEDDEPVVGLGDHVPAFLLRPTRPARTAN